MTQTVVQADLAVQEQNKCRIQNAECKIKAREKSLAFLFVEMEFVGLF